MDPMSLFLHFTGQAVVLGHGDSSYPPSHSIMLFTYERLAKEAKPLKMVSCSLY
jgi:hypothetical protein